MPHSSFQQKWVLVKITKRMSSPSATTESVRVSISLTSSLLAKKTQMNERAITRSLICAAGRFPAVLGQLVGAATELRPPPPHLPS
jgi:hypothetical protein